MTKTLKKENALGDLNFKGICMAKTVLAFYIGVKNLNQDTTFFDRLVCWATGSIYSHVELVVDYDSTNHSGWCWSSSSRDGGVRLTRIPFKRDRWHLFEVESQSTLEEIEEWFKKEKGKKYDWLGAFGSVIFIIPQMPNRWFCSEAVSSSLKIDKPSKKTPEALFKFFNLSTVEALKKD